MLTDIEQVVVQGQLTLCLLVDLPRSSDVLKELLFAAKQLGMSLDFNPVSDEPAAGQVDVSSSQRYVITAIARSLGASHIHAIASTLAGEGANIEKISRLSEGALASVEIHATLAPGGDPDRLRRALLGVATRSSFDVALQREGLFRRSKRLVVMDMDSTLIRIEVIDELARAAGVLRAGRRHHRAGHAGGDELRRIPAPAGGAAGRARSVRPRAHRRRAAP